jgi:predicted nuclease of restriction endonuclease-like RecB superfamily
LISLKHLRITVRKGKAHPKFADAETRKELSKARDLYEDSLGIKMSEFSDEAVRLCFSDRKAAESALSVLARFYAFRSRSLGVLLGEEKTRDLSEMEIEGCVSLRLKFFEFLSTDHSGFMSSEARESLLAEFAGGIGVTGGQLEEALWLDEDDSKVLERVGETSSPDLHAVYNLEVLSAILCNSYELRLGPISDGGTVKFIFKNLRFHGLLFRTSSTDDGFVFQVDGPMGLFGRANKFGYRMAMATGWPCCSTG